MYVRTGVRLMPTCLLARAARNGGGVGVEGSDPFIFLVEELRSSCCLREQKTSSCGADPRRAATEQPPPPSPELATHTAGAASSLSFVRLFSGAAINTNKKLETQHPPFFMVG